MSERTEVFFLHKTHVHVSEREVYNTNTDDAKTVVVTQVKCGNAAFLNE
jgi:hypothetical protein